MLSLSRRLIAHVISVVVISSSLSCMQFVQAESVLQVLPTRVVLEGPKRSMTVTLINRGDKEGSYRMFFRNIRANDHGELTEVEEAIEGELFSDKMVRFSPRRITVPARSKQSIRVVTRKPQGLGDGEYRSHLVFRKLPTQTSVLEQEAEENTLGFAFKPIVEITIPIIVRHGETDASMRLSDATVVGENGEDALQFTIHREGNRSLYGDVDVWLVKGGDKKSIAMARGIAVYSPNDKRIFTIPLDLQDQNLNNGTILLEFNEDPAYGGNLKARLEKAI